MSPRWKRFPPPGTAPGTLLPSPGAVAADLEVVTYTADGSDRRPIGSLEELPGARAGEVRWLDVHGLDTLTIAGLRDRLDLHPLVAEDMLNVGQRPKVEVGDGWLVAVVQLFRHDPEAPEVEAEQVSLLLANGTVVTVQERAGDPFDPVRRRISEGLGVIRENGPDYLFYALLDAVVDHIFPVLEAIGERLETLEDEVIEGPRRPHVEHIHALKRTLIHLRRAIWPTRELLSQLVRGDSPLLSEDTRYYLRDVYEHAVQLLDIIESCRETLASLMDLYLSSVSNRMNEVMKVLTVIATIFIPLSFIAGLYGMNFDRAASPFNMPELGWRFGYPFALGLMAGVVVLMLWFFRRKRWL